MVSFFSIMVEVECTKNAVSYGSLLYLDTDFFIKQEHHKTSLLFEIPLTNVTLGKLSTFLVLIFYITAKNCQPRKWKYKHFCFLVILVYSNPLGRESHSWIPLTFYPLINQLNYAFIQLLEGPKAFFGCFYH